VSRQITLQLWPPKFSFRSGEFAPGLRWRYFGPFCLWYIDRAKWRESPPTVRVKVTGYEGVTDVRVRP
jgi:hypothetical protein